MDLQWAVVKMMMMTKTHIRQYMWNEGGYLFNEDGEIVADDKVTAVFDKICRII